MKQISYLCLLLFVFPLLLYPQYDDLKFEHLTVEDGLSNSAVIAIVQDYKGYLWFGTIDGLNRYDGYKFTIFKKIPGDSNSLSHNYIRTLYEDRTGQLWIGTGNGGLCRYNRDTDDFTRYKHDKNDPNSLESNQVVCIHESSHDSKNILWIGTAGGVNRYLPERDGFKKYYPEGKNFKYKTNQNWIGSITPDYSGRVWFGTWQEGLFYYDITSDSLIKYDQTTVVPDPFINKYVMKLLATQVNGTDVLWMATAKEYLYKIDTRNGFIKGFRSKDEPFEIFDICGSDQTLWISTYNGLYRFETEREIFDHYLHEPGNLYSIRSNLIHTAYQDKSGLLWVGTDGIAKLNPQLSNFSIYERNELSENSLSSNVINTFCETGTGDQKILWIGTRQGLNRYNPSTGKYTVYKNDPNDSNSLSSDMITSAIPSHKSHHDLLWIATQRGLNRFDPVTGTVKRFFIPDQDPIVTNEMLVLCEDDSGHIWIGTQSSQVIKFNPDTESYIKFQAINPVRSLLYDSNGYLWIGTLGGLRKFDPVSGKSVVYRNDPEDPGSLSNDEVFAIYHAKDNIIWLGTGGGLNRFDQDSESFTVYTEHDGLPSDLIVGILEDDRGDLWLSTGNGLSRFDPGTKTVKNYYTGDGLPGNQFRIGAMYKNEEGEMIFGGMEGFVKFHPENILENNFVPPVMLTDFLVFNKHIRPGAGTILNKPIADTREIKITYDQSVVSFEFAALDYHNPQKNRYAYRMEGIDPAWVHTDAARRFATYTNLDPGEYSFRVKGANNDDVWNEQEAAVKLIVLPPWWKSGWAYGLYSILIIGFLYSIRRYELKRQRLIQELEMEHFEANKLREVDQLKSRFFADISHEFRTPLTLIKGPAQQIMSGDYNGNLADHCRVILNSSDRLLNLINQILELSKLEAGQTKIQVAETDLTRLIKGLVRLFASLAESKHITLQLTGLDKPITGYVDGDKVEKIITNLITNAIKFTPEGGEIIVECRMWNAEWPSNHSELRVPRSEFMDISVSNTGPVIPAEQLEKFFDRFYRSDSGRHHMVEGTGIGLALTKELVEIHHGKIAAESIEKNGAGVTTFSFWLPIDKGIYPEAELVDKSAGPDLAIAADRDISSDIKIKSDTAGGEDADKSETCVLLVEDNQDVINFIRDFLKKEYRIITAVNGAEGFRRAIADYPDLVISDVMMPGMDGFELCQKIKTDERVSHIPVILLTARADLESRLAGLDFGADDYISKPFDADELRARSRNLIIQRKKLREKFARMIDVEPDDIAVTSADKKFLQRFMEVVECQLSNPEIGTEQISREVGMSRSNLNRKIKALTDQTPHQFIRTLRLKRAANLLRNSAGTVSEIAYQVGFNNISHFAKSFREQFGQSPGSLLIKTKL